MKKLSSLFILLALVTILAGCSPKEEVPPVLDPNPNVPPVESVAPLTEDTAITGDAYFDTASKELELISE